MEQNAKACCLAAALTIGLGALTGCSGTDAYCNALKENANATNDPAKMTEAFDKMRSIQGEAPADVKDDWDKMIEFLEKWRAAKGDTSKVGDLAEEAAKMQCASSAIEKHAKDECGVELPM